jgi:hypothetical protein
LHDFTLPLLICILLTSNERSRRNNKKKKIYANAYLFSLRAEEEDEEEGYDIHPKKNRQ